MLRNQYLFMKIKYISNEIFLEFIKINDIKIKQEREVKLIGITMDDKFKFNKDSWS